jgi:hypothetical protein
MLKAIANCCAPILGAAVLITGVIWTELVDYQPTPINPYHYYLDVACEHHEKEDCDVSSKEKTRGMDQVN